MKQLHDAGKQPTGMPAADLVITFTAGSMIGYAVETVYCSLANGQFRSRKGLLHGPFNQVYGVGALVMSSLLTPLHKKGKHVLFLGGALLGGAFEWTCSWLQEKCFGKVSWDYTGKPFSIGGRTSLQYMVFWGALGVVYICHIQAGLLGAISRLPGEKRKYHRRNLGILLAADMLLSASAVARWKERQQGVLPRNRYEQYVDFAYPDDKLKKIYPSMRCVPGMSAAAPGCPNVYQ